MKSKSCCQTFFQWTLFSVFSVLSYLSVGQVQPKPAVNKNAISANRELSAYSLSVRGGLTQFYGEMNSQDMKGMVGISLERAYTKRFSLALDYTAGKLGGERIDFFNSYFVNEYNTLELLAKWNLTEQFSKNHTGRFNFNVYGGLGMMYFSSNAYDITSNELVRFSNSALSARNPLFLRWGNAKGPLGVKKTRERVIPLGMSLDYMLSKQWKIGLDYRFYFVRSDKVDATSGMRLINPEEGNSYSNTPNDKFSFLSLSVTYRFSRPIRDTDNDGIPDDRDRCPTVPGTQRFYGCPDSDNDGIPDYVDKCPSEPGSAKNRGCPDRDNDGFIDRIDECPDVAGTLRGCPDRDGDGVLDNVDVCPDIKGEVRYAGCPDSDGDGISDALDKCPDQPGTFANKGCPDSDGDGVNDFDDKCVDVPGPASNNGCPVMNAVEKETLQRQIDDFLATPIRFVRGTDLMESSSYGNLDKIALLLARNRKVNISIEGHTDGSGNQNANQLLSVQRAEAVKTYLAEKGIPYSRMSATGFGDSRPIESGKTAQDQMRNRRVEIKVK